MYRVLGKGAVGVIVALAFASSAYAAEPSFDAHGSVEQVYATGLSPGAAVSLLDPADQVVETRNANDLGGTLFRNVQPGSGYHVTSGGENCDALTAVPTQSPPPATHVYDPALHSHGYAYMKTRDGNKHASSVQPQ